MKENGLELDTFTLLKDYGLEIQEDVRMTLVICYNECSSSCFSTLLVNDCRWRVFWISSEDDCSLMCSKLGA